MGCIVSPACRRAPSTCVCLTFIPATLDANGDVITLPKITVQHNGMTIHNQQEIPLNRHRIPGPLHLQDHGHKIQFRNIWLVEGE